MSNEAAFRSVVDDLADQGYAVSDDVFLAPLTSALRAVARTQHAHGLMTQARTGKAKTQDSTLRGDSIVWLDEHSPEPAVVECLALLDELRQVLNRQLFMNLHEVETHLALYPPGAVYKTHLDQFATGEQNRQLSLVLYLNQDWLPEYGGELRLYLDDTQTDHVDVSPVGGRLVLFLSSRFWHEVRPSHRDRLSLTGWFRTRSPM